MLFVSLPGSTVNLRFGLNNNIGIEKYSYNLGDELFKFLSFDMSEVYSLYVEIAEAFMDYHYGAKDRAAYAEKLAALCGELDKRSIYLHWYTVDFVEHMTQLQKGRKYVFDSYLVGQTLEMQDIFFRYEQLISDGSLKPYFDIDFLENYPFRRLTEEDMAARPNYAERDLYKTQAKNEKTKNVPKAEMRKSIGLAVLFLAEDLKRKRTMFCGDIEAITGDDATLDGLSLTQKLYMLDIRRRNKGENPIYPRDLWRTSFEAYPRTPYDYHDDPADEKEVRDFLLKSGVEIKQVHEITTAERLIIFELLTLITSGAFIKKCKYCGNYFVPQGRSDTVFCDRIARGELKPCSMIGSLKLHKAAKADNPIHEVHLKAYRRMNSKARTRRISQSVFLAWSDEARAKRDACLNGELPFEDFTTWLDEDKKK